VTHKHAPTGVCRTVCGIPCDRVDIVYAGDTRPVTCADCAEVA
jgi:hypothetical protein